MDKARDSSFSFPEVRIVEASAGSGKTYALAKRYVQLLINPTLAPDDIPLKEILAITFTNKATVEMKERILEFLKKIALDRFSNDAERVDILASLGVRPEKARQKAFFAMDRIIRNYDFFQIKTIDSFVNSIITGCAFRLDLSARFTIKTDYAPYLAYSLDALIDRSLRDAAVMGLFRDFLKQYLHVESKFGWFPKNSILSLIDSLYQNSMTYGGSYIKTVEGNPDRLFALKRAVIAGLAELADKLPRGTNGTFAKWLKNFLEKNRDTFSLDALSKSLANESFPMNGGAPVPSEIGIRWDALRRAIIELCEYEAASFYNCYIDTFSRVIDDFRSRARRDDVLFLGELNTQARELFSRRGMGVPELYFRLSARLRHFLIDEFQDTSALQWKNVLPLVEEALASGGSLFYVGDRKQAIYRFRGGDATLFDRIPRYFTSCEPRRHVLDRNYRSGREIVLFNNELFATGNLTRFLGELQEESDDTDRLTAADVREVLGIYTDSEQKFLDADRPGYVSIRPVDARTIDQRNEAVHDEVMALMADLTSRYRYRDIAFLARDNSDIELLTGWLLQEKIPVQSEKTLNVKEYGLVKEIVSFLRFLNSPIDNLSFASFLTGEIFERSSGMPAQGMKEFIHALHRHRDRGAAPLLYREFRSAYPAMWEDSIEKFFVNVGYYPLYELVVSVLDTYKVMEHFPHARAFVMRFLEIVKTQEKEHGDIASFLSYFDRAPDNDLFVTVTDTDAVRMLTIHKAKGLEFPVVIVPFFEMAVGGTSGSAPDLEQDGDDLSLLRLSRKYVRFSEKLQERYRHRMKNSIIDELNTAYVALTRARSELYAFVPEKASAKKNAARVLVPEPVERGTKGASTSTPAGVPGDIMTLPPAEYRDWIGLLKDEFRDARALSNRRNVLLGETLHDLLARAGNLAGKDMSAEISRVMGEAQVSFSPLIEPAEIEKLFRKTLEEPALRKYFAVSDGKVFCEKEVLGRSGAIRRFDRLIVTGDEALVVDYKSSEEGRDSYLAQVREYIGLIKEIYPEKKVSGVIIYLNSLKAEEVV